MARIIGAQYPGRCRECGGQVVPGQSIEVERGVRGVRCIACVDPQRHQPINREGVRAPLPEAPKKRLRTYKELFGDDD